MLDTHGYPFNRGTWYGQVSWDDAKPQTFVNHPNHIRGQQFWVDLMHRFRIIPTGDEAKSTVDAAVEQPHRRPVQGPPLLRHRAQGVRAAYRRPQRQGALLTAQHTPPSTCGMFKYEEYNDVWEKVKGDWSKVEANQMPVRDFANLARKAIEDAKLGSKTI